MNLVGVGDGGPGQEQGVPGLPPYGDDGRVGGVQNRAGHHLVQGPEGQQGPLEVEELRGDVQLVDALQNLGESARNKASQKTQRVHLLALVALIGTAVIRVTFKVQLVQVLLCMLLGILPGTTDCAPASQARAVEDC